VPKQIHIAATVLLLGAPLAGVAAFPTGAASQLPRNPGTIVELNQCVRVALPGAAEWECGDQRFGHALPSARTLNRVWTPVLTYNSAQASPRPLIGVNVRIGNAPLPHIPPTVEIWAVSADGHNWGVQHWTGWIADTRRIVYDLDGAALATGIYPITMHMKVTATDGSFFTWQGSLEVVVVNRRHSPFGSGWWLAGLEQIHHLPDNRKLWVGGDGSARAYTYVNDSTWVNAAFERQDTIKRRVNTAGINRYVRLLHEGGRVVFGSTGYQDSTVSRVGEITRFQYSADAPTRLTSITLPRGAEYHFEYGAAPTVRLRTVRLQQGGQQRIVQMHPQNGDLRISSITDPDGSTVEFGCYGQVPSRIGCRRDRRGNWVYYGFDPAGKLTSVHQPMGGDGSNDIHYSILPTESRGRHGTAAVLLDSAYTLIDGPRTDVMDHTRIWVNRWGAPTRIRDALGAETHVHREHPQFPALVTRTVSPNGYTHEAVYDQIARSTHLIGVNSLGDGRNDTTRIFYTDPQWPRRATEIRAPEGESTFRGFDTQGNRIWDQIGPSVSRRVHYEFNSAGQVETVRTQSALLRGEAPTRYEYDPIRGNLSAVVTPLGIRTNFFQDALGRDTVVDQPFNGLTRRRTRLFHDAAGRDTLEISYGDPAEGNRFVSKRYDAEGNLLRLGRWSSVDPRWVGLVESRWTYDAAHRVLTEVSEGSRTQTHGYTPGVRAWTRTPNGDTLRFGYDALNRVTHQIVPSRSYSPMVQGVFNPTGGTSLVYTFPHPPFANGPGGTFVIPADTTRFAYDPLTGLMTEADNRDAHVRRGYYPNGLLRTETTRIRTWAEMAQGGSFTQHSYTLEYGYDRSGRRTWLRLPENIAPRNLSTHQIYDLQQYGYHPVTGALTLVRSPLGLEYSFTHNDEDQLTRIDFPGQRWETYVYDAEGRRTLRQVQSTNYNGPGNPLTFSNTYEYYDGGQVRHVDHPSDLEVPRRHDFKYTRLGRLSESKITNIGSGGPLGPQRIDRYHWDALGNRIALEVIGVSGVQSHFEYNAGTGQVRSSGPPPGTADDPQPTTHSIYDLAGNQIWFRSNAVRADLQYATHDIRTTRSYYGADDRLRGSEGYTCRLEYSRYDPNPALCFAPGVLQDETAGAFEWYRYDALGRRVLVRTRRDHTCTSSECSSAITRFIWDGDQILFEIRADGGNVSAATLENDSPSGGQYGRVFYTHGGELDAPLDITREGFWGIGGYWNGPEPVIPIGNWRGHFIGGTDADGRALPCQPGCIIAWPGSLYEAFFLKTTSSSRLNWFGSLIKGKEDANGMFYRRNRYYNPHTGTFTQEDPIGLAGGLNLYGYAGGDPVNFHDPFGLCAEELKDKRGRCPGGWDEERYRQIESYIQSLDPHARGGLMGMLEGGRIRRHGGALYYGEPAGSPRGRIVLATEFFNDDRDGYETAGRRAFVLAHEYGHQLQRQERSLLHLPMNGRGISAYFNARRGSPLHHHFQNDANVYACQNTTSIERGNWQTACSTLGLP
jgi:RHS repeat-associated protein